MGLVRGHQNVDVPRRPDGWGICLAVVTLAVAGPPAGLLRAQEPVAGEVRQIVTFSFLPGRAGDAVEAYRGQAIPLYQRNDAMLSFRGFREVESPIPMDLMLVSSFAGMSGMDRSNSALRDLASAAGTSIGAIYGEIGRLSSAHTDQFVEMLPALGSGDPSSLRLTAFVWYRLVPGQADVFEDLLASTVAPWEDAARVPSATGRVLVSDGWHYLRMLGFASLGDYHAYWSALSETEGGGHMAAITAMRREVIVSSVPEMSVR